MTDGTVLVTVPCPGCGASTPAEMRAASTFVKTPCAGCGNWVVGRYGGDGDD